MQAFRVREVWATGLGHEWATVNLVFMDNIPARGRQTRLGTTGARETINFDLMFPLVRARRCCIRQRRSR
jgi:hypothetical protein